MIFRTDALLCSINDRLAGGPGADVGPLSRSFLSDLREIEADGGLEPSEPLAQAILTGLTLGGRR